MSSTVPAVVTYAPEGHPDWRLEQVSVSREVGAKELKVRMVATGVCHTDVFFSNLPEGAMGVTFPKILGHEGAGIVETVGVEVTVAKPGDKVMLSFNFCGKCELCTHGPVSYCDGFTPLNFLGEQGIFAIEGNGDRKDAKGKFFGQSSFSSTSIVDEASVVNVSSIVQSDEELKVLAPMGCGLMTGTGTVLNSAKARPHDILVVAGIGAVGCGAIMAANVKGVKAIIAVDRVPARLKLAKELRATHTLDTTGVDNIPEALQKLVPDSRISLAIDTTGVPVVLIGLMGALGKRGKLIQIGIPPLESNVALPMADFFFNSKTYDTNIMGEADTRDLIPQMIQWWREGKYDLQKLIKYFDPKDSSQAIEEMENGTVIKPVFVW